MANSQKSWKQLDHFVINNCKIANELRKYRDLSGFLNRVSLSGERTRTPGQAADYAEYHITEDFTYLDMVTANAAYTLMTQCGPQVPFQADVVAQIMAGDMGWRIADKRKRGLEERLEKLARTRICILADHDHQVERDLYEGPFLPVDWEGEAGRRRFHFRPGEQMPLYQYADDHRQLIRVPFQWLAENEGEARVRHNNSDRRLLLRHYLIQELQILLYQGNKVEEKKVQLLKTDREGREFGLLWTLGLAGDGEQKDRSGTAKGLQQSLQQLLEGWSGLGLLDRLNYEILPAEEGYGARFFTR